MEIPDATTIGGVFSGLAVLVTAVNGGSMRRQKRQKQRLDELEARASRDAKRISELEDREYLFRRYMADLRGAAADRGLDLPALPPGLASMSRTGSTQSPTPKAGTRTSSGTTSGGTTSRTTKARPSNPNATPATPSERPATRHRRVGPPNSTTSWRTAPATETTGEISLADLDD